MRRDQRFLAALVAVGAAVTFLVWTGISDTWVYFVTPSELLSKIEAEPASQAQSWRLSGLLVPKSHTHSVQEAMHRFRVQDPDNPDIQFDVEFPHTLPDTFTDDPTMEVELVMEGTYQGDGRFVATEVLAKCGSRFEAMPEPDVALTGGGVIE